MEANMAAMLDYLLTESERGGMPPSAIVMNSRSLEAFRCERYENGESGFSMKYFKDYPILVDNRIPDFEIMLPGFDEALVASNS